MISRLFLLKNGTLFISQGRNVITSISRNFSNTNMNCTSKQPLASPLSMQDHYIVAYHVMNHRVAIEIGGANSVLGANYTVTTPFFKPLLIF